MFVIDKTGWPILTVRPQKPWTLEEWRAGWHEIGAVVSAATGGFALLIDATQARPPSALERAVVSEFFSSNEALLARHCAGLAIAVSNPIVRAAATAVFWVSRPPVEVTFHREPALARQHLRLAVSRAS